MIDMKVKLDVGSKMPEYAHDEDAALDLFCKEYEDFVIDPHGCAVIDTGVHVEIPRDHFGDVRSKSGRFFKQHLFTTGTIDEGYTGSIKICIENLDDMPAYIGKGEKIAQMAIIPVTHVRCVLTKELDETERGSHGFGSTGVK